MGFSLSRGAGVNEAFRALSVGLPRTRLLRIDLGQGRMPVAVPDSVVVGVLPRRHKGGPVVREHLLIICQVNTWKVSWTVASQGGRQEQTKKGKEQLRPLFPGFWGKGVHQMSGNLHLTPNILLRSYVAFGKPV